VREDGILYEARLPEGRGFDPALRVLRRWLKKEASGKRVLTLGPGASALGVAAASGGARSTTGVDPGETAEGLEAFLRKDRETYDLAAIEIPCLEGVVSLLSLLARRMAPSGVVYLVTRAPRPRLDVESLSGWSVEDVSRESIPEDFRSRKVHRIWRLVRNPQGDVGTGFGSAG
jgi:hypothetical protein